MIEEAVISDQVEVLKRPSGGESVILTPKTLIISALVREEKLSYPKQYFEIFNQKIINGLVKCGIQNLNQKGISDICIGEKKILGSAIYRKPGLLFYHAVLNVSESPALIEKYLKHPQREPEYRKSRKHSEFVSSIQREGYILSASELIEAIE